jgi:hypothetical protein
MKNVSLLMLATLVACSDPVPVATELPPKPIVVTTTAPAPAQAPAKFNIGESVMLENLPDGFTAVIAAVGEVEEWLNQITGETVMQRAYIVVVTNPDGVARPYSVPEVVISAK